MLDTTKKILVIVESPNKIKTIKQYLPSNWKVDASAGHILEIKDTGESNMGIDCANGFTADYAISSDKRDIVERLKAQVKASDIVYICSDPDREGEDIAWELKEYLKIPESKYKRATFHEITKNAIIRALENPRKIDYNIVHASEARKKGDKIIGYKISSILRKNIDKNSYKSKYKTTAGRCQSAGLKIVVDREEEITSFVPAKYKELFLTFDKDGYEFKAKYIGTDSVLCERYDDSNIEILNDALSSHSTKSYIIKNITNQDKLSNPKLPFTTSTLQQEVASKLGIGIKQTESYAQKLFEGINVGGKHISLITYIRTDSTDMSPEFAETLKDFVIDKYGKKYYSPLRKGKKSETAQDGHECIRCVDLEMTPEKLKSLLPDASLVKIYEIIYKRTVASSMACSVTSETTYDIYNNQHKFRFSSRELKFDGYKKVYSYKDDSDDEEIIRTTFSQNEVLNNPELSVEAKQTKPPKRFTEASLVKELDRLGIGRPSTYGTIVGTILSKERNYCEISDKAIVPTERGSNVSHFLVSSFPDIFNIGYTVEMEKELDKISEGELDELTYLTDFYNKLVVAMKRVDKSIGKKPAQELDEKCPECGSQLMLRSGKFGQFIGCKAYPKCKYTRKIEGK